MTNTLSTEVLTPVLKSSILPRIRKYIQNDVTAGKGHKIAMVQLAPRQAVVFFLEGMLTRKHFDAATEGSNYVDIPRVMIEGRSLTVRVRKDAEFTVATLDTEGKMV